MAVTGFVLTVGWLACTPFPFLEVWVQPSQAVVATLGVTCITCMILAPVVSGLGLRWANLSRRPHRRLALAALWLYPVPWIILIVVTLQLLDATFGSVPPGWWKLR